MTTERLGIRLDPDRRRKLADMARRRGSSTSVLVREAIDRLYEMDQRERRFAAVEAMRRMQIEDVPEPEELSRQLDQTYDIGPLP